MSRFAVSFGPAPTLEALAPQWRDLESRADCSFFTSWSWIGCWLESLPPASKPMLLQAKAGARTVGLAVLVPRRVLRHQVLSSEALYLHATGDPQYDTLTIESNGLLVEREQADDVSSCMIDYLVRGCPQWEEIFLEAMAGPPSARFDVAQLRLRRWERPTFAVDLQRIRRGESDYYALLGRKVRYQIQRSIKAYSRHGAVRARAAADAAQAIEFFEQLKDLHQTHWIAKGLPGAFGSPFTCRFHTRLISQCFDRGEIQLLKVEAGDKPVGYLYNFVHRGIVSNYQSGIGYGLATINNSPGLAVHFLCALFNAQAGHRVYDLMMGDYEYKRRICTDTGTLHWAVVQRRRLKFSVEDTLRTLKARWRRPAVQAIPEPAE